MKFSAMVFCFLNLASATLLACRDATTTLASSVLLEGDIVTVNNLANMVPLLD